MADEFAGQPFGDELGRERGLKPDHDFAGRSHDHARLWRTSDEDVVCRQRHAFDFGGAAEGTLEYLLKALPELTAAPRPYKRIYLGGYSLAGLFALWAGCRTECFDGIAAASPSVWFPNFTDWLREQELKADRVYLSLGDREERTRNPVMARVGEAIRETEAILKSAGRDCVLEWNKGNHFKEPDVRTAKAFAWLLGGPQASFSTS